MARHKFIADALLRHKLYDSRLRLRAELPVSLRQHIALGKHVFRAYHLDEKLLRIAHLQAVLAVGAERQQRLIVGVVHRYVVYHPSKIGGIQLVDNPHLGGKRILAAKRYAEQLAKQRYVLGVERMLARPEFRHQTALAHQQGFLRLVDYQLGVRTEIGFRISVCKHETIALWFPTRAVN